MSLFNAGFGDGDNTFGSTFEAVKNVNLSPEFRNPPVPSLEDRGFTGAQLKSFFKDFMPVDEHDYPAGDVVRFKDRTYFGSQDYAPINLIEDIVETSKTLGVNPLLPLSTAATESRFWQSEMKTGWDEDRRGEGSLMRLLGNTRQESGTQPLDFSNWIMKHGYMNSPDEVIKKNSGYYLTDDFISNTPPERLKHLNDMYSSYREQTEKELADIMHLPYSTSIGYLKKKGIVDYNPYELAGYTTKEEGGFTYTKDRIDRVEGIYGIMKGEDSFMGTVDSLLNVTGDTTSLATYQKDFESFIQAEQVKTDKRRKELGLPIIK